MAMLIMLKTILVMRNIFQNHSEYRKETTKYNITSQNGKSQENNFTMEFDSAIQDAKYIKEGLSIVKPKKLCLVKIYQIECKKAYKLFSIKQTETK